MLGNKIFDVKVLEIKKFNLKQEIPIDKRQVKDYEIDFNIGDSRTVEINGVKYDLSEGDVLFKKPGEFVSSVGDYDVYVLTLDFTGESNLSPLGYMRDRVSEPQPLFNNPIIENIPSVFKGYHKHDYIRIFDRLIMCSYPMVENNDEQKALVSELLYLINCDLCYQVARDFTNRQSEIINKTRQYINYNFEKNISLKEMADRVHLSPNYLLKIFKKETGIAPKEYILRMRIEHAKFLLSTTNMTIKKIALECGFSDASYFSFYFKKYLNITPIEYRKNQY